MNTKNKIKFTISSDKKSENYVITKEDSLGFHHLMFVTVPELKVLSVMLSKLVKKLKEEQNENQIN